MQTKISGPENDFLLKSYGAFLKSHLPLQQFVNSMKIFEKSFDRVVSCNQRVVSYPVKSPDSA